MPISKAFAILLLVNLGLVTQIKAQVTATNLPIITITTPTTIGTTQIQGTLSIINNATGLNHPSDVPSFTGMIGINQRGNTTYPKSSYSVETWSVPTVSLDTSILGMPAENDWVLLSAYEDRSLMRNVLGFRLHEKMGRYASRQRFCEVIVNSQYMGIYTFGEKIKRDSMRVDIAKLTTLDNSGINLTGGYIVKIDGSGAGWVSSYTPPFATTQQINFEYDYPDAGAITPVQQAYIKSFVDSFENSLNATNFQDTLLGWRQNGAVNAFADFMILQEVSKNNQAYRKNTYLYKDKGTKLRPGPLWGMEVAWHNTADCNGSADTGWCYNYGGVCDTAAKLPPFWWQRLASDTSFIDEVKCRYTNYRQSGNLLDTVKIFAMIDSMSSLLNANGAISRNFTQWPIWGVPIVNEPTPMAANYTQEVAQLKSFITARLAWLDSKWISTSSKCYPLSVEESHFSQLVDIYPNPASDKVSVRVGGNSKGYTCRIQNLQGQTLGTQQSHEAVTFINLSDLPAGIYILQVCSDRGIVTRKLQKQ
jgi:hypothetical protein